VEIGGVQIGSADDLVSRLKWLLLKGEKPVAFITGAGVSLGAVDGVGAILAAMRGSLGDDEDIQRFDREVTAPTDSEKYQQAAGFLLRNRDQDLLNKIIRLAVMRACTSMDSEHKKALVERRDQVALRDLEFDPAQWTATPATTALGTLLRFLPPGHRGPVITTNFDPLLEIAVRKAGARPNPQYLDRDGVLHRGEYQDSVDITHVHGYWRLGDTLHTIGRLTEERPELDGSLMESLRNHTVVVIGYSGWADAFSKFLRTRARQKEMSGIDLVWCSYAPLTEADFETGLFNELRSAPRIAFYHGIDANDVLPRLCDSYLAAAPQPALDGWVDLDTAFLEKVTSRTVAESEVLAFFDGAQPDWPTALDPRIPRLSLVTRLTEAMDACLDGAASAGGKRIVAAVGPMGDGKSMALRQATADLARSRTDVSVHWKKPGTPLDPDAVLALPPRNGHHIVLATDEGALVIADLRRLMMRCRKEGRDDIRVLLAAQEREWGYRGAQHLLGASTEILPTVGLTPQDGNALVTAWEALDALRELAKTPAEERAGRLVALAAASTGRNEDGALIGAMLQARYGPLLRDHVKNLLDQLGSDAYPGFGTSSLREAFLMIAILHVAVRPKSKRAKPLSVRILTRAAGLKPGDYRWAVEQPLGLEAAVTGEGNDVWVRHLSIAEAALDITRERDPAQLPALTSTLVRAAVSLSSVTGPLDDDVYSVAYLSSRLSVAEESVAAGEAAVAAAPSRLSYRTSHMAALRRAGRLDEALQAAQRAWSEPTEPGADAKLLLEWGTAAGRADDHASNALLDGVALRLADEEIYVGNALLNMGVALTELHRRTSEPVYLNALRAVVGLVSVRRRAKQHDAYLARHSRYLDVCGTKALDGEEAWEAVQSALDMLWPLADPSLAPVLGERNTSVRPRKGL
jgi:hypothetical protein